MRLSTDADRDEAMALSTIAAAAEAGITVFDTARAYGTEELLARALREREGAAERARIVTKGGVRRRQGRWAPDGRASAIREDCEASLAALGGLPIDLYLLHAPDPKTPFATSVRALASLPESGKVRRIGLCDVTRAQLEEALALAPISAVELELSPYELGALEGGVVEKCVERGLWVLAHSPLGGPERARKMTHDPILRSVAARRGASPQDVVLAVLLELHPSIVVLPGAGRPELARACAAAAKLTLEDADRASLRHLVPGAKAISPPRPPEHPAEGEVVLIMGVQGSGKTDAVARFTSRGYERLNRDERGGTLRELNAFLDERLSAGLRRVVLDNTYLTRASRREVLEVAARHRLPVRCIWQQTPLRDAQVNVVLRMLARHGRLLGPEEMRRPGDPGAFPPQVLFRSFRALEPPSADEGFAALESVHFERRAPERRGPTSRLVELELLASPSGEPLSAAKRALALAEGERTLAFGSRPGRRSSRRRRWPSGCRRPPASRSR